MMNPKTAVFSVAGISGRRYGDGPVHACSEEGWDVTLDHNLKSTFLVCRAFARQISKAEERMDALEDSFADLDGRLHRQDRRIDRQGAMSSAMLNMAINAAGTQSPRGRIAVGAG